MPSNSPNVAPIPDESAAQISRPLCLEGGNEVDSSDDEDGFELEPPPVLVDGAVLAAVDRVHEQDSSSDGSESGDSSSVEG